MRKSILATAIVALSFSGATVAHEAGDIILRVGAMHADPDVSNPESIKFNGEKHLYDAKLGVKSDTGLGLSATYMILPRFGLELMASTPFTHKINEKDKDDGEKYSIGKTSRLSPTVSAQFFFLNPKFKFQPYVGLGLSYNLFYNEKPSREMKEDGAKNLKLKNSVGWAAQLGMDYMATDRVMLNASVWKMGMYTKMSLTDDVGNKGEVKFDLDPWVYFLGVGYKF